MERGTLARDRTVEKGSTSTTGASLRGLVGVEETKAPEGRAGKGHRTGPGQKAWRQKEVQGKTKMDGQAVMVHDMCADVEEARQIYRRGLKDCIGR